MISGRIVRRVSVAGVAMLLMPIAAAAQRGQDAGLLGVVRDPSGAAIPRARVTVASADLIGGAQSQATNDYGSYRFLFLPPGRYDITVEQVGFTTAKRMDVELPPGLTLTVDVNLPIAELSQTVLVERFTPTVDVHSSASQVLIDRHLLENLPLSRTATDAVNLAPGVVRDVAFGGSVRSNPFSLDGTNGNEPGWGTPTVYPNLNWLQEIQIVGVGADAQYGEYTGALQNAITRSGSNRFSGLVDYWTTRPGWTGNNRGSLTPQLQERFRPVEIIDRWDSDFQVGGPIRLDRVWFFAGGELYRNVYRPASFSGIAPTPGEPRVDQIEPKMIAKLTSALTPAIRVEGYIEHDTRDATGLNAGPLVQPEALLVGTRPETMWNARALWTLNSRAVLELRHGGHNARSFTGPPEQQRGGPGGHYDQLTGVQSVNATSYSDYLSRPITTGAHLTYLLAAGNRRTHEFRTGFEYEHARLYDASGPVGGITYYDYDGQPDTAYIGGDQIYRPTHDRKTVYVQDRWNAGDRLTLNLGVRAGFYRGGVPTRESAFSGHSISPRAGAAWDVAGDHRTVVRANYGRYHDQMVTSFYDFLDPLSQAPTIIAQAAGPNEFVPVGQFGSTFSATIDPDLKYSYMEEYVAAIERELAWGIVARGQFIRRDFNDSIGFIDTGRVWRPEQRIDPGPDGRVGSADDGGPFTVFLDVDPTSAALRLTNPAGAYRRYRAIQFVATKRRSHGLDLQWSYTWSRTVGSYNNAFSSNAANNDLGANGVFVNPNRALNAEGRTPQDFTHELKGLWTYRLPAWGMNVSGVYRYQSGRPWARMVSGLGPQVPLFAVAVEPRDAREMQALHTLDVRVEKTFTATRKAETVGVFLDVFNIGNQGVPAGVNMVSGPNFNVPTNWIEPRSLRAGLRLSF